MKIKSKNVNVYGGQISLPYNIGTLSVSEDGVIEIPEGYEEVVSEMIENGANFEIVSGSNTAVSIADDDEVVKNASAGSKSSPAKTIVAAVKKPTTKAQPQAPKKQEQAKVVSISKTEDNQNQSQIVGTTPSDKTPLSEEEKALLKKALLMKNIAELKKLCAGLPEEEWGGLNKSELIKYLLSNSSK